MTTQGNISSLLLAALFAYLVGSLNISVVAARFAGVGDIRKRGSGNAGATNLFRAAGPKIAIPVLLIDIGKAVGVILVSKWYGLDDLAPLLAVPLVIGNMYPIFHKFKGGKGVATATGSLLAISWLAMLMGGAVFLVIFVFVRRISASSLAMVASWALWIWFLGGTIQEIIAAFVLLPIILFSHRANIGRLIRGEESKFELSSRSPR